MRNSFSAFCVVLTSEASIQMRGCTDNLEEESVKDGDKFEMRQSANNY